MLKLKPAKAQEATKAREVAKAQEAKAQEATEAREAAKAQEALKLVKR